MPAAKVSRQDSLDSSPDSPSSGNLHDTDVHPASVGSVSTIRPSAAKNKNRKFGARADDDDEDEGDVDADEETRLIVEHSESNGKSAASSKKKANGANGKAYGTVDPISRSIGDINELRKVKERSEKRTLTSPAFFGLFLLILVFTFINLVLTLVLALDAGYNLDDAFKWAPYRGSGLLEVWIAALGAWAGFAAIIFFSAPIYMLFLTNFLSLLLMLPIFLLIILSPPLRRAHFPLLALPLSCTVFTYFLAILASWIVRRAQKNQSKKILAAIAARQAEDASAHPRSDGHSRAEQARREREMAKVMVGLEGSAFSLRKIWGGVKGIIGFFAGLASSVILVLLFANLCLTAYDNSLPLIHPDSQLIEVHPAGYPWSFKVHLLCTNPPPTEDNDPTFLFPPDHRTPRHNKTHAPTILYEAPRGVPGSIAHLKPARLPYKNNPFPVPRPPNNGTIDESQASPYPGSWIISLQQHHKIGRVCVWDRPGYGFSENGATELGQVADALQEALKKSGEKGPYVLVGDGYGGLITRVFASRHASHVHSILHIDAQTAQTYFRFPPRYNLLTLTFDRLFNHLIPTLVSPLGIHRFYSLFAYYDPAIARVLASNRPAPSSTKLSEKMQSTLLREMYLSHTHDSPSYKTLLKAQPPKYPADKPAIILSSDEMMQKDKAWAEGQRSLAEEITSEEHRVSWEIVKGKTGHDLCSPLEGKDGRGRRYCTRALKTLYALD